MMLIQPYRLLKFHQFLVDIQLHFFLQTEVIFLQMIKKKDHTNTDISNYI